MSRPATARTTLRPPRLGAGPARLAAVLALAGCFSGCAADTASAPARPGAAAEGPRASAALRRLESLAAREAVKPDRRAMQAGAPPGVDDSLLAASATDAKALLGLEAALADLGVTSAATTDRERAPTPDGALRAYLSGRENLLGGDAAAAAGDFLSATRLDPDAVEPRRELGEARLALGNRPGALTAFREALERDPGDIRSLEQLGRAALQSRDAEQAARLLGAAWLARDRARAFDAAAPFIIAQDLGAAMGRLGYLAASAEALTAACDAPDPFGDGTRYWREIGALARRKGEILRDAGDAYLRLGKTDLALGVYARAAESPSSDEGASLAPRRVLASLRAGRPAAAMLAALDSIGESGAARSTARLLRHIAVNSPREVSEAAAQAIVDLAASLPADRRASLAPGLLRARAAVLPDDEAIALLTARVGDAPTDEESLADLFERSNTGAAPLAALAVELASMRPAQERRIARALLASTQPGPALAALEKTPPSSRGVAWSLIAARLQAASDTAAAEATLRAAIDASPESPPPAAVTALAELLGRLGRTAEADAALARLKPDASPDIRYAAVLVLQSMQRYADALAMLRPLLDDPGSGPDVLHRGAELSAALGDAAAAESLWRRVIALDPTREDAFAGLISLYVAGGPLASDPKLADVIRDLRAANPSGRTLRRLAAREYAARGQYDRAERDLAELTEQDPSDTASAQLLVSVWLASQSGPRAEQWLRDRIAAHPEEPNYAVDLARVLTELKRPEQAEPVLRQWLERRPGDFTVSRALETLLRVSLKRADEADALAEQRLARSPRTVDWALERASLLLRRGDPAAAAQSIREGVAPGVTLRADQARLGGSIAAEAARLAEPPAPQPTDRNARPAAKTPINGPLDETASAHLDLLDLLAERLPAMSDEAHRVRIALLARRGESVAAIKRACDLLGRQQAQIGQDAALYGLDALRNADRAADALGLAREAALARRPASPRVLAAWIIVAAQAVDSASAVEAIRAAVADRSVPETIASLAALGRGVEDAEQTMPDELAYTAGVMFAAGGHEDDADRLYRLALEYNPDHGFSNNNLGYRMAERGERLAEAHALLMRAYRALPGEAAVLDSLGWVRYRLGLLEDKLDANGQLEAEGAIALLRRASLMAANLPDAAVLDHLGDAYWAAGSHNDALGAWSRGVTVAKSQLAIFEPRANEIAGLRERIEALRALVSSMQAKAEAAAANAEPMVAPVLGDGRWPDLPQLPPPAAEQPNANPAAPQPRPRPEPQPAI